MHLQHVACVLPIPCLVPGITTFDEAHVDYKTGDRQLILFKFFDVRKQRLFWLGSALFYSHTTMREVLLYVRFHMERLGMWPDDAPPAATTATAGNSCAQQHMDTVDPFASPPSAGGSDSMTDIAEQQHPSLHERRDQILQLNASGLKGWEEEVGPKHIVPLDPAKTLADGKYRNGDLLLVQVDYPPDQLAQLAAAHRQRWQDYRVRTLARDRCALGLHGNNAPTSAPAPVDADDSLLEPFCEDVVRYLKVGFSARQIRIRRLPWHPGTSRDELVLYLPLTTHYDAVALRLVNRHLLHASDVVVCDPTGRVRPG